MDVSWARTLAGALSPAGALPVVAVSRRKATGPTALTPILRAAPRIVVMCSPHKTRSFVRPALLRASGALASLATVFVFGGSMFFHAESFQLRPRPFPSTSLSFGDVHGSHSSPCGQCLHSSLSWTEEFRRSASQCELGCSHHLTGWLMPLAHRGRATRDALPFAELRHFALSEACRGWGASLPVSAFGKLPPWW